MLKRNSILNGDCLELMKNIENKSIDLILADLPYGTTACKWDSIIPFDKLWLQYERIIKDHGAIVLTAAQPFTSALVISNPKLFRYEWIWNKQVPSGHLNAKFQPMRLHESILVFYKIKTTYNRQFEKRDKQDLRPNRKNVPERKYKGVYSEAKKGYSEDNDYTLISPKSILNISNGNSWTKKNNIHPTQKPVALFEYLIKTYTNEGELILDNTAGSMTTAIACINTNRDYICMEQDEKYFRIGSERVKSHIDKLLSGLVG